MKKLLLLVTHVLLPISYLLAENGAVYPDTSLQISPVTIVSNKPANLANVSRIGLETIENRYETSVLSLLSEEVPGLFTTQRGLMGYGVAGGAAGTINIRGLGGSPSSQVLMLIDGQPQYMGLMGHPLADTYLASMAEQVTVNRGPASVLYGSNALGGTININTTTPRQGIHNKAQVMYGSYNS
ncbi:MAG: TonB-dependent receptor plug domain-containing protein, partial [Bacteroidales bacterium]